MPQPLDSLSPDHSALDHLARELRAAVLATDHSEASRLSTAYTEALRAHWTLLSEQERANSHLPKQSIELLTWAQEMTAMQRALAAEHLAIVEQASRYGNARSGYLRSAVLDAED
jgi:histidinol dehydrogenase